MKKVLCTVACALFILSCTQDDNLFVEGNTVDVSVQPELTMAEAQTKFAIILSKAVSNSEEVRRFLKEEALAYFDNDNDVFYPFVKDKIVAGTGSQTFRNILLSYCDSEEELEAIEKSLPLLNILIPDLTLFWDFNAQKWNTAVDDVTVFCRDDETNSIYEDGESIGQLQVDEIPGFPCLVVKNNERLRVSNAATRTVDGVGYEFISDAYDGSKRKAQTRDSYFDVNLEAKEDVDAYVNGNLIKLNTVKEAYKEFKDHPTACQRDYIYYGMTKDKKSGILNKNIAESLFRFRIEKDAYSSITNSSRDPRLQEISVEKRYFTNEEILRNIWTDGVFEFYFYITSSDADYTTQKPRELHVSVAPQKLFSLTKAHVHHKNSTMFRHSKNTYTADSQDLESKWVYLDDNDIAAATKGEVAFFKPWDLSKTSSTIVVHVEEYDEGEKQTYTEIFTSEYTQKTDYSISTESGGVTVKKEYGTSNTMKHSTEFVIERTVTSNNLGTVNIDFSNPIIKDEKNGTYDLLNYSLGDFIMTFIPVDMNE